MKSWLNKIIKNQGYDLQQQRHSNQFQDRKKKIIVSFDKHSEQKSKSSFRQLKNKQQNSQQIDSENQNDSEKSSQSYIETLEASQQIVNNLTNICSLIKVIKNIPEAKGEYITLTFLRKLISKEQILDKKKLADFILNKSSEGVDSYGKKKIQERNEKAYKRIVKRIMKNTNNVEQKSRDQMNKFFYRNFSNGITHQYYPIRSLIWKILSGYLPDSKEKWVWKMEVSLLKYRQLVKQHIVEIILKKNKIYSQQNKKPLEFDISTKKSSQNSDFLPQMRKKSQSIGGSIENNIKDHPLNSKQSSKWKKYFEDFQLWSLIQKDTVRTRQTYPFFNQPNLFSLVNDDSLDKNDLANIQLRTEEKIVFKLNELHLSKNKKQKTTYIDSLTRIIYIYLKVHSDQKYYQGMNQMVALIYFSLTNKNSEYFRRVSQSDTYQIFSLLIKNLNMHPLNNHENIKLLNFNHFISGQKYFDLLQLMLKKFDFRLYEFLQKNKGFQFLKSIAIRWFMTIFLSQFSLDQALILWDCVMVLIGNKSQNRANHYLKNINLTQFMLYMALIVIDLNRKQIIENQNQQRTQDKTFNCTKILLIFQKIKQKPEQIIQKSINLYKSFPNLLD